MIGGVLLLIAEIIAPGFFLVFVGAAAIATGLFTLLFDLGIAPQLILFAVYAVAGGDDRQALVWRAATRSTKNLRLNDPSRRLVGKTVTVVEPVDDHGGRVRVGDGEWNARGGPGSAGRARAKVTGVEGNCLIVEPVRALPPA